MSAPGRERSAATRERILSAIRLGMHAYPAVTAAGITLRQFATWCEEDAAFAADVERARAEMESAALSRVEAAAQRDPRAAAWLRERNAA